MKEGRKKDYFSLGNMGFDNDRIDMNLNQIDR